MDAYELKAYLIDYSYFGLLALSIIGWVIFVVSRDNIFKRSLFLRLMPMSICVGVLTLFKALTWLDSTRDLFTKR